MDDEERPLETGQPNREAPVPGAYGQAHVLALLAHSCHVLLEYVVVEPEGELKSFVP